MISTPYPRRKWLFNNLRWYCTVIPDTSFVHSFIITDVSWNNNILTRISALNTRNTVSKILQQFPVYLLLFKEVHLNQHFTENYSKKKKKKKSGLLRISTFFPTQLIIIKVYERVIF